MKMYRTVQRVETNSGIITAAELRARLNLPPGTELIVRLDGTPPLDVQVREIYLTYTFTTQETTDET